MTGPRFDQKVMRNYIIDGRFHGFADAYEIVGGVQFSVGCTTLGAACRELVALARNEDRLIVSWSQYDGRIMRDASLTPEQGVVFADRYRDGKATAKRWYRQFHA